MTANIAEMRTSIEQSAHAVANWVERHEYKGYEPFDGLSSYLRPLTRHSLLLDRLLMQLIRQSPINLRPLLGVRPQESTKGRGYMASGYLTMLRVTGDRRYEARARTCLDWLMTAQSPLFPQYSWGNCFDFASRGGRYPKDEPIVVWTALIGDAFLDAYERLGDAKYLGVASSICDWILGLPREETPTGTCISYHALDQSSIHNANMLGAAMLARTAQVTGNVEAIELATAAMEYSCSRQHDDGGWFYAEDARYHWIDSFHTGYNLVSLKRFIESTGDTRFEPTVSRGLDYFCRSFFYEACRWKYFNDRLHSIDIQFISQAIETLALFGESDAECLGRAYQVATWAINNMQDKSGYFYYRQYPLLKARTPMLHWGQATMYRGLTRLVAATQSLAAANEGDGLAVLRRDHGRGPNDAGA